MSLDAYSWSEEEKAVVTGLGLTWSEKAPVDYRGYVWFAHDKDENRYVAKWIKKGSFEIKALQMMLAIPSPRNRILPGRLFECEASYIYVMPRLELVGMAPWAPAMTWNTMLDQLYIMVDYVEFMQEHNVAFIDISLENTVWSMKPVSYGGFNILVDQIYFIDYGSARILPAGPGSGVRIYDYNEEGGKYRPTESRDVMDPYAYDIFALGYTFKHAFWWYGKFKSPGTVTHVPRSWDYFAQSLSTADPKGRPSIFRTRRLFIALRVWTSCTTWLYKFSERFADNFGYYGWRIISPLIR